MVAAGQFAVSSDVRPGALTASAIQSRNRQYGADVGTSVSPLGGMWNGIVNFRMRYRLVAWDG